MRSRLVLVSWFLAAALSACAHRPSADHAPAAVSETSSISAERNFIRDLVRTTVSVSVTLRRDGIPMPYRGAGIVLDWSGNILTNDHVLVGPDAYTGTAGGPAALAVVSFCDLGKDDKPVCGTDTRAVVIRRDPLPHGGADLALLRLCDRLTPPPTARPAKFAERAPTSGEVLWRVGRDPVPIAMGYYLESVWGFKEFRVGFPVASGASGGPVFNSSGEVVGITRAHEPERHWRLPVARVIQVGYIKDWLKTALPISKPCAPR
jgi:S1-C subfamily serine protease